MVVVASTPFVFLAKDQPVVWQTPQVSALPPNFASPPMPICHSSPKTPSWPLPRRLFASAISRDEPTAVIVKERENAINSRFFLVEKYSATGVDPQSKLGYSHLENWVQAPPRPFSLTGLTSTMLLEPKTARNSIDENIFRSVPRRTRRPSKKFATKTSEKRGSRTLIEQVRDE